MNPDSLPNSSASVRSRITEVKYSLPDMLEELKAEREASVFTMEKLEQSEISKMFKAQAPRANTQE